MTKICVINICDVFFYETNASLSLRCKNSSQREFIVC